MYVRLIIKQQSLIFCFRAKISESTEIEIYVNKHKYLGDNDNTINLMNGQY